MTKSKLARNWKHYQQSLFPGFEDEPEDPATEDIQRLYHVLDTLQMGRFFRPQDGSIGRPPKDRLAMLRSFISKAVLNIPTTKALIERLKADGQLRRICQWESRRDVPSEGTFSNAFAEFSESGLPSLIHEELVRRGYKGKLVGHVARDATAIEAREKPAKKAVDASGVASSKPKKKRGRPKADEERAPAEETRIEKQIHMPLVQSLAELPKQCDRGAKTNAKGYQETWNGYKLHLDVTEHGVPISCVLTSASLHDSQVAIPLETMTADRITHCYSLMDKGYSSEAISFYAESLGKVAIIDPKKPRGGELIPLDPAKKERYKIRTVVERTNSELKDNAGGRYVRVKGNLKVMTHLMFGVLVISAEQLLRHVL